MPVKVPPKQRTLQTAGKRAARRTFLRAGTLLSQQRPACLRAAGWAAQVKPPFRRRPAIMLLHGLWIPRAERVVFSFYARKAQQQAYFSALSPA